MKIYLEKKINDQSFIKLITNLKFIDSYEEYNDYISCTTKIQTLDEFKKLILESIKKAGFTYESRPNEDEDGIYQEPYVIYNDNKGYEGLAFDITVDEYGNTYEKGDKCYAVDFSYFE